MKMDSQPSKTQNKQMNKSKTKKRTIQLGRGMMLQYKTIKISKKRLNLDLLRRILRSWRRKMMVLTILRKLKNHLRNWKQWRIIRMRIRMDLMILKRPRLLKKIKQLYHNPKLMMNLI